MKERTIIRLAKMVIDTRRTMMNSAHHGAGCGGTHTDSSVALVVFDTLKLESSLERFELDRALDKLSMARPTKDEMNYGSLSIRFYSVPTSKALFSPSVFQGTVSPPFFHESIPKIITVCFKWMNASSRIHTLTDRKLEYQ